MNPAEYCQQKAAMPGSSLYYSLVFLPPAQRDAMTALHAFVRELENIITDTHDPDVAARQLDWWQYQLDEVFAGGKLEHPVSQALVHTIQEFDLPQELLSEIVDGIRMDMQQSRHADFKSLQLYCYRVSSTLCTLSSEICGYTERSTQKFAHELGIALKLYQLIINVGADARRGRIYLPVEDLQDFNVPAAEILESRGSENFDRLIAFQIQRAQNLHQQALTHLAAADRKAQRPLLTLAAILQAILGEIGTDVRQVLNHRVSLTPLRKLWIATRIWLKP